jgi:broad specificity phosphatase PhoE
MSDSFPAVYLARHAETEWSVSGQHTGLTDLPLTERGEQKARQLGSAIQRLKFVKVFTSPLRRAARTCELCGFKTVATVEPDLVEWNYGQYEGLRSSEIHQKNPNWQLFRDGCPGGESPQQVAARADRVVNRARAVNGNVLIFSSGHFLRMLGARWLGLEPSAGELFVLSTASLSALSYEHDLSHPVVQLWNNTDHIKT